ncbi:MAG TPA: citrate/2-methylcitrate synthase [Lacipirellulaceae bacterium]|jgi:citrate synthase|nr:citrate/2-methylcitrate synthase [Lacipirellulaceae bacterium]
MPEEIYSPGLEGVIAGETAISTVSGGLSYRGYSIEDLARYGTFEEVAYLLLYGELPNAEQLDEFRKRLETASNVPAPIIESLRHFPSTALPMDVLRSATSMLAHWDSDISDNSHDANIRKAERLLAQLPIVMAAHHRLKQGKEPVAPEAGQSLASNCLNMLFRADSSPGHVKAMDVSLILYAEHEYNASTFTSRVIVSTLADLHSGITGAIGALKGPLHGGANEKVMDVLGAVGKKENAETWIRDALARKEKIMGFGHRVYKNGDPRAVYLKELCNELAKETGNEDLETTADVIQRVIWEEKKLPPNLDWPSGRLYHYMNLPVELYTPLFVLSRVAGWAAHIIEQLDNNRLIRPRARYIGHERRAWKPIAKR